MPAEIPDLLTLQAETIHKTYIQAESLPNPQEVSYAFLGEKLSNLDPRNEREKLQKEKLRFLLEDLRSNNITVETLRELKEEVEQDSSYLQGLVFEEFEETDPTSLNSTGLQLLRIAKTLTTFAAEVEKEFSGTTLVAGQTYFERAGYVDISLTPREVLEQTLLEKAQPAPIEYITSRFTENTRLIGLEYSHTPLFGGLYHQVFAGKLLDALVEQSLVNTLFIETSTNQKEQKAIQDYVDGQIDEAELKQVLSKGDLLFLDLLKNARELVGRGKELQVIGVDNKSIDRKKADQTMKEHIINYLTTHSDSRGLFFAGGDHVKHRLEHEGKEYYEVNTKLEEFGYQVYGQQAEYLAELTESKNPFTEAVKGLIKEPIVIETKNTILQNAFFDDSPASQYTFAEMYDAVIIHPPLPEKSTVPNASTSHWCRDLLLCFIQLPAELYYVT